MKGPARHRPHGFTWTRLLAALSAGASFGVALWCLRHRLWVPAIALFAASAFAAYRAFFRRAAP